MGLFSKEPCCLCEVEKGKFPIKDGKICVKCYDNFRDLILNKENVFNKTKLELKNHLELRIKNESLNKSFNATKAIGEYIEFDQEHKQFRIPSKIKNINPIVYNCDDIIEFELIENGETVTSGGLGRAVAGGVILGGVGAIVGGVTGKKKSKSIIDDFKIKLLLNDFQKPTVYIELLNKKKIKTNSNAYNDIYEKAQEILSTLAVLQNNKDNELALDKEEIQTISAAEQIREFKSLFDDGIISEDEFNAKKKELLGI